MQGSRANHVANWKCHKPVAAQHEVTLVLVPARAYVVLLPLLRQLFCDHIKDPKLQWPGNKGDPCWLVHLQRTPHPSPSETTKTTFTRGTSRRLRQPTGILWKVVVAFCRGRSLIPINFMHPGMPQELCKRPAQLIKWREQTWEPTRSTDKPLYFQGVGVLARILAFAGLRSPHTPPS